MSVRHWLLTPLVVPFLLAGCIHPSPTVPAADVFVVEYRLVDLDPEDDVRQAEPGHHCGDARIEGDVLKVWLWPEEERPDGPWLAVFATLPSGWHSGIEGEPFKTTFPHTLDPGVWDDPTTLGRLEWEPDGENGTMRLDGKAVSLPYTWRVTGEDGAWRADATLRAWDGRLVVDRYTGLCD